MSSDQWYQSKPLNNVGQSKSAMGVAFDTEINLEHLLAKTSWSTVYKGSIDKKDVAVKIPNYQEFPDIVDDVFTNEAEMYEKLEGCANIPSFHGMFEQQDNQYFLVTDFVDGVSLKHLIDHKIPMQKVFSFTKEIAKTMQFMASKGIVYRDLHPNNIMVNANGINVIDFGLARETNLEGFYIEDGVIEGSVDYISREVYTTGRYSQSSDVHGLSAVTYHMIFEQVPFKIKETTKGITNFDSFTQAAIETMTVFEMANPLRTDFSWELYEQCEVFYSRAFDEGFDNFDIFLEEFGKIETRYLK